jgi:predicted secreted Zn-dependent protease
MQVSAQRIIIGGEETSRLLKWSDFTGSPDYGVTYWNISYSYDAFQYKGDTAKWKVQITVELGKNSWKKKDKITDTLLKHEQGHFDIGILCAMELQQRVNATVFFKNDYQAKLALLIKEVVDIYKKMDLQYDEETKHHANREQQWKWDAFFAEKIKRY